jgi:hypothetical protein
MADDKKINIRVVKIRDIMVLLWFCKNFSQKI